MTNIDVSIIIVNYDITSLVVNAIDSLFHKIKDLTIEIIFISNVSNFISPPPLPKKQLLEKNGNFLLLD
ncbi:MAG: hypothetical protein ACLVKC_16055 [Bacteroides thetaiotaomicron]